MTTAEIVLWGRTIGAISWDEKRQLGHLEYAPEFVRSKIEVSPITMPLSNRIYSFPALARETFHGLPGLAADSLPDRFGSALIDAWLAKEGREPHSFNPVERLCYVGKRGMGALEFEPARGPAPSADHPIDVASLVELASEILTQREGIRTSFDTPAREAALRDILRVGTSAGGARAKAIIAWNPETNEVRSGQVNAGDGFEDWLLKFDGVSGNRDRELEDPQGYGLIEYAYHLMAVDAGIDMATSRILTENGRHHFMTRRFDRSQSGRKIHMLTLGALAHFDFNAPGAHSYEQALRLIQQLRMSMTSLEQQFRRMTFNIVARNQDDHVKNIAFLMNQVGEWSLSPAFDLSYSYNPSGAWTNAHQMSLNGKRDDFTATDFEECARAVSMKRGRAATILAEVTDVVRNWNDYASRARVPPDTAAQVGAAHRTNLTP